jgi:lysophospholipase L1-like esterase
VEKGRFNWMALGAPAGVQKGMLSPRSALLLSFLALSPLSFTRAVGQPVAGPVYDVVFVGDSITAGVGTQDAATQAAPVWAAHDLPQALNNQAAAVYFFNQGRSGHTTTDFLPGGADFTSVVAAATQLEAEHPGQLVFSIMLGTNDSANRGPTGAPLAANVYVKNLRTIIDQLLAEFPKAKLVINHPLWYSPNTHNGADYEGSPAADRLKSYFPAIAEVITQEGAAHPGHVFLGDTGGYDYFSIHFQTELLGEPGVNGTFYLHPNPAGAKSLGRFWAEALAKDLRP